MSDGIDEKARRSWESMTTARCGATSAWRGESPLGQVVEHFAEKYPHVPMSLNLNYATATWSEPPTADDRAKREANRAWSAERQARWEADMYAKLKAKFEPDFVAEEL